MKALILTALFSSPSAFAYGYYTTTTTQQVGNTTYTNTYGNGYNSNITTQRVGNTIYSNGTDNRGNRVNCTTYGSGNYRTTNCN
jgi:hypothetical protein